VSIDRGREGRGDRTGREVAAGAATINHHIEGMDAEWLLAGSWRGMEPTG